MSNLPGLCTICTAPLGQGTIIGDGDGTGIQFAHYACYYRREADSLHAALAEKAERIAELEGMFATACKDRDAYDRIRHEKAAEVERLDKGWHEANKGKLESGLRATAAEQRVEQMSAVVKTARPFYEAWNCVEGSSKWVNELTQYQRDFVRAFAANKNSMSQETPDDRDLL